MLILYNVSHYSVAKTGSRCEEKLSLNKRLHRTNPSSTVIHLWNIMALPESENYISYVMTNYHRLHPVPRSVCCSHRPICSQASNKSASSTVIHVWNIYIVEEACSTVIHLWNIMALPEYICFFSF